MFKKLTRHLISWGFGLNGTVYRLREPLWWIFGLLFLESFIILIAPSRKFLSATFLLILVTKGITVSTAEIVGIFYNLLKLLCRQFDGDWRLQGGLVEVDQLARYSSFCPYYNTFSPLGEFFFVYTFSLYQAAITQFTCNVSL